MQEKAKRNFILQQGFGEPSPASCSRQYAALHFQPRVVFVWVLIAIVFQFPPVFYVLGAVLLWSVLVPKLNPFDAVYNLTQRKNPMGMFYLSPAPPPRRTAQAMAGGFALACGLLIHFGLSTAAYVVEAFFVAAVLALVLGAFCFGSFVYQVLVGRGSFARRTLPWANLT
jgi:Domain of unknown function (DUF4395)